MNIISLLGRDMLILKDHVLAKAFDTFFKNAVGIQNTKNIMNSLDVYSTSLEDPIDLLHILE